MRNCFFLLAGFFALSFARAESLPLYMNRILRGAQIQIPANAKIIQNDSTETSQKFTLIYSGDTIRIQSWNYEDLGFVTHVAMFDYIELIGWDDCYYYRDPSYAVLPKFTYPFDSTNHQDEVAGTLRVNEYYDKIALEHIAIIDSAIASFNEKMGLQLLLHESFFDMTGYRAQLNDSIAVSGNLKNSEFDMILQYTQKAQQPKATNETVRKLYDRKIGLSVSATVSNYATMVYINHLIKTAQLD